MKIYSKYLNFEMCRLTVFLSFIPSICCLFFLFKKKREEFCLRSSALLLKPNLNLKPSLVMLSMGMPIPYNTHEIPQLHENKKYRFTWHRGICSSRSFQLFRTNWIIIRRSSISMVRENKKERNKKRERDSKWERPKSKWRKRSYV